MYFNDFSSSTEDPIVAATIHLGHLAKDDVIKLLKLLEPYDDKVEVKTRSSLEIDGSPGSLGLSGDVSCIHLFPLSNGYTFYIFERSLPKCCRANKSKAYNI